MVGDGKLVSRGRMGMDTVCAVTDGDGLIFHRVPASPGKSWIFFLLNSSTWKVLQNHFGPGKSWKLKFKVMKSHGKIATRCHILRLKYTQFDFGWGSAPDPYWGSSQCSPRSPSWI